MVDRLHIPIWNRTRKPLAIALSGVGRGLRGRDDRDNVTNVQFKCNQNCHYETPPYHEYILINFFKKNPRPYLKNNWRKRGWGVAQGIEWLSCKHKYHHSYNNVDKNLGMLKINSIH
jgi:hypothetical protein